MTDISVFKKMLQQPDAPAPGHIQPRFVWLHADEPKPGKFYYRVWLKGWPLSELYTHNLAAARAAAEWFGVPVKEHGPSEAFGRKPKPAPSFEGRRGTGA
jgi:hypothetical protein